MSEGVVEAAARMLAERRILGLYLGRCEYGPRALGARTIMASPADRSINDWLNKRLDRTEFMPFAPVVRDARVNEAFDLPRALHYTARYMTVTCNVTAEWRHRIPAVVHVDGTARPQVIRREDNPTYYDILRRFEEISGLPCAINTSFNAHEEPIINRPEEALRALEQGRVDLLVTETGIFAKWPWRAGANRPSVRCIGRHAACLVALRPNPSEIRVKVVQNGGDNAKRQCHARESGHPDLAARGGALDSRFRGNDTTLKDLILNDAPH